MVIWNLLSLFGFKLNKLPFRRNMLLLKSNRYSRV